MTLQQRLDQANQQSVSLYLRRQQIEEQRQQIALQAQQCDLELVRLDGVIRTLSELIAAERASGE